MFKKSVLVFSFFVMVSIPTITHASVTSDLLTQIQVLLKMVVALQQQVSQLQTNTMAITPVLNRAPTIPVPIADCPILNRTLTTKMQGDDVSQLQTFLRNEGVYEYPSITGYFGPVTQRAVQDWQRKNNIVMGGSPIINGFGVVNTATQEAIRKKCGNQSGNDIKYAPFIHSFSGPAVLAKNQVGTWRIKASDPKNGILNYVIKWGDNSSNDISYSTVEPQFVQNTTFTHSYINSGTYSVVITVRNSLKGLETQTTATVTVTGNTPAPTIFSAAPSTGSGPLTVTFTSPTINPNTLDAGGYSISYGDGTKITTIPTNTSGIQKMVHTYAQVGTFTAILYANASGLARYPFNKPTEVKRVTISVLGIVQPLAVCTSSGNTYTEGRVQSCIDVADTGSKTCIIDAQYVCRSGTWKIEGSLPQPTKLFGY